MDRRKSFKNTKISDLLNVEVVGYVVYYWHSSLPCLKEIRFNNRASLNKWIYDNKASLFFSGKPIFTIESIMRVKDV